MHMGLSGSAEQGPDGDASGPSDDTSDTSGMVAGPALAVSNPAQDDPQTPPVANVSVAFTKEPAASPVRPAGGKKRAKGKRKAAGSAEVGQFVSTALPQDCLIQRPQGQIACLIEAKYQELLASQRGEEGVSITAFAAFIKVLSEVRKMIQEKHTSVTRKHKLVAAQLARSGGGRSTDKFFAEMNKLEAQHESLQRDQAHYNTTIDMLKKSPAYQKLLDLGEQLMTTTCHGEMVLKSDLEVEEEVSFEDLLGQMKLEEAQALQAKAGCGGSGRG